MHDLQDKNAFKYWVPKVLRMKRRVISGVSARVFSQRTKGKYWKMQYKFGIKVPRTIEEAFRLDEESQTTLWIDAIRKEMGNVRIAFEEWKDGTYNDIKSNCGLVGYQEIKCQMIFDIKMDFTRKARFVAGGHTTETPTSLTYSSVVSRESVRIGLLIAALHDIDVSAAVVGNAYLNAPCRERIYTVAGPEFQSEQGKVMVICRALHGLKSSGAAWRNMLPSSPSDMGYKSTLADADVWRVDKRKYRTGWLRILRDDLGIC
jgi:Reverse transcriptase (RNA-dependent DNA polymerase)